MTDPTPIDETQDIPRASVTIEYLLSVLINNVEALVHELRVQNRNVQQQQVKSRQHLFIGTPNNDA
jgi:hypothetical protein